MGLREAGVELDGAAEHLTCDPQRRLAVHHEELAAAQVHLVRLRVARTRARQPRLLAGGEPELRARAPPPARSPPGWRRCPRGCGRRSRPRSGSGRRRSPGARRPAPGSRPCGRFPRAAWRRPAPSRPRGCPSACPLNWNDRPASRDAQAVDGAEGPEQLLGDPVAEVVLVLRRAEVGEGQHGDGGGGLAGGRRAAPQIAPGLPSATERLRRCAGGATPGVRRLHLCLSAARAESTAPPSRGRLRGFRSSIRATREASAGAPGISSPGADRVRSARPLPSRNGKPSREHPVEDDARSAKTSVRSSSGAPLRLLRRHVGGRSAVRPCGGRRRGPSRSRAPSPARRRTGRRSRA